MCYFESLSEISSLALLPSLRLSILLEATISRRGIYSKGEIDRERNRQTEDIE